MIPQLNANRLIDIIPAFAIDVESLLPSGWQQQIHECSGRDSKWQHLRGGSVTSRESDFHDVAPAEVGVVTGDVVQRDLQWLDALYRREFLELANRLGQGEYQASTHLRGGININTTPVGARYEWHVDSNPLTALLFVTTHAPSDGGQLLFRPDPQARPTESWELQVSPSAGTLLIFDAREAAHVVTQLTSGLRISVPMNYYFAGREERPEDLDGYLYN